MDLQAKFDKIVGWDKGFGDPDPEKPLDEQEHIPPGPAIRNYHFTIGKVGDLVSGGLYIKVGPAVPKEITIKIPNPWKTKGGQDAAL